MSGEMVFILCSIILIAAFTAYMIWTMRRRQRLVRMLTEQLKESEKANSTDRS